MSDIVKLGHVLWKDDGDWVKKCMSYGGRDRERKDNVESGGGEGERAYIEEGA